MIDTGRSGHPAAMPRRRRFDSADVDAVFASQNNVATHAQLRAVGMPAATVTYWARNGPFQRIFPGVVVNHRGTPTLRERRRAAVLYAGPGAVITGLHALDLQNVLGRRIDAGDHIDVLIPHRSRAVSTSFVRVERSTRDPRPIRRQDFPTAPIARAAADAARLALATRDEVREVFGAVLQQKRCSIADLRDEVYGGQRRNSAKARAVLAEVSAGVRSAAESKFRLIVLELVQEMGLAAPLFNEVVVVDGIRVGEADGWWPHLRLVVEIDSYRWHLGANAMRATQDKERRYAAAGIIHLPIAPVDLVENSSEVLDQLRQALVRASAAAA